MIDPLYVVFAVFQFDAVARKCVDMTASYTLCTLISSQRTERRKYNASGTVSLDCELVGERQLGRVA
jgi:hypothetical protein